METTNGTNEAGSCRVGPRKAHRHGPHCGHTAIGHQNHVDYLVDGRLEHQFESGCVDHRIEISELNPDACCPLRDCELEEHVHGPGCGHELVPHGDHFDYLVNGTLHHPHEDHCDDHGPVELWNGQDRD